MNKKENIEQQKKNYEVDKNEKLNKVNEKEEEKNVANEKKEEDSNEILEDLKNKLEESEDRLLRSLAETENLRKRHDKEINDLRKYAINNFACSLLSIADNFERALQTVPESLPEDNLVLKNLVIGIKAIEKEFYDVFEKNGILKFSSLNTKFNPELHQAVSQVFSDTEEGFIVKEHQKGFKVGERLLRPAMVVVSKGTDVKETKTEKKSEKLKSEDQKK